MTGESPRERYLAAQRRRVPGMSAAERCVVVDEPGVFGWAAAAGGTPTGRLWVTGEDLGPLLDRFAPLILSVDACVAPSVAGRLAARLELRGVAEPVTGMLLTSAADLGDADLPAGLLMKPVRRQGSDGVPLEKVAAACRAADPGIAAAFDDAGFAAHLRRAPDADLLAAVDGEGRVVGTAATALLGDDATVYLVSTDVAWRGRGVASALTAEVTRRAFERGARSVSLEASAQGRGLYARLGFRPALDLRSWIRVSG